MSRYILYLSYILWFGLLCGCDMQQYPDFGKPEKPQILIYSGMTMLLPVTEVAELFEELYECEVKITFGSSGHIYTSVQANQIGDIFFPGSVSYIEQLQRIGIITDSVEVGYNQAAIFVAKGNPLQITADFSLLLNDSIDVVIANPATGAIGRETKKILEAQGIYNQVAGQAQYITTGFAGLIRAIESHDADLVINWQAAGFSPEHQNTMEMIAFPQGVSNKQRLVMGSLKYSRQPELLQQFLAVAHSKQGRAIFAKYGLAD